LIEGLFVFIDQRAENSPEVSFYFLTTEGRVFLKWERSDEMPSSHHFGPRRERKTLLKLDALSG
jgi:hypothetical protein